MIDAIEDRILHTIYCLSRDTRPIDAVILGRAVAISATAAAEALVRLERASLVDASRARLTMLGLARACQIGGQLTGASAGPGAVAAVPRPAPAAPPLAAGSGQALPSQALARSSHAMMMDAG
ncbi:MAG: hypothetical protein OXU20_21990 [Myxococcales bacterium]|nr:hypothetical protein [Myxococcales bacterium]